jgi:hypothetical protein
MQVFVCPHITNLCRVHAAANDNAASASRVDSDFAQAMRESYGPNTCKSPYVWREADLSDWVSSIAPISQGEAHSVQRGSMYTQANALGLMQLT